MQDVYFSQLRKVENKLRDILKHSLHLMRNNDPYQNVNSVNWMHLCVKTSHLLKSFVCGVEIFNKITIQVNT